MQIIIDDEAIESVRVNHFPLSDECHEFWNVTFDFPHDQQLIFRFDTREAFEGFIATIKDGVAKMERMT